MTDLSNIVNAWSKIVNVSITTPDMNSKNCEEKLNKLKDRFTSFKEGLPILDIDNTCNLELNDRTQKILNRIVKVKDSYASQARQVNKSKHRTSS